MKIRVQSSNIWRCDENKPRWSELGQDCSAAARAPLILRALREVDADVIGFQEVSSSMQAILAPAMAERGFEFISGGDTPIAYRADRFLPVETAFLRFSEEIPGLSGSFNNGGTKSFVWAVFETRGAMRERFALLNMHLWWKSEENAVGSDSAREWQFRLASGALDAALARYQCAAVATGDFNAAPSSPCLVAAAELGWTDAHDIAPAPDETKGTHPCNADGYGPRETPGVFAESIDHILTKSAHGGAIKVESFRRLRESWFDPASDHYPLWCDIAID